MPRLTGVALLPGTIANDFRTKTAVAQTGGRDETRVEMGQPWVEKLLLAPDKGEDSMQFSTDDSRIYHPLSPLPAQCARTDIRSARAIAIEFSADSAKTPRTPALAV
jgi:hypothetical protein